MHDVHTLERKARVPTVAIVSEPFASQAVYQAEALGMSVADMHIVLADHPISNATTAEIEAKAEALYPFLLKQLCSNDPPGSFYARRLRAPAKSPTALCQMGA